MICGGAAGSDPFFGYRTLLDKLLVYRPDIVLLAVNHSDILDVTVRGGMERFLADGTVKGVDPPDSITPAIKWLYQSSHFARFLMFELFDYTHHIIPRTEREKLARQALQKIMDLVREYNTLLQSKGIDFTLVIHPFRGELKRNRYDHLDRLREFALQHGIDVIDTMPYLFQKLKEHNNRLEDLYWPGDNHFTGLGYGYFAAAVDIGLDPTVSRVLTRINEADE